MDFIIGCNYWASNSGADMWRTWDESAVREDIEVLAANGIEYMRVFPNWRDFQPVAPVLGGSSDVIGYCLEGDRTPENPEFLDEIMIERFRVFCDICAEHGIKLIVGLVTGWMSGRSFVPSALFGKDLYTDPTALLFEQRLVRGMVSRFKYHEAIFAWDLGNECNCIGRPVSEVSATSWSLTISNAIKAVDSTRPVVSGMHCLAAGRENGHWTISGQAEASDILTTHPYPYWMKFTGKDHVASFRTAVHATCETKYYSDVGKRPCLVEEIGTMGPMLCNDERAAAFMRLNLLSNWINGAEGVMWWCANEQTNLMQDPYSRQMVELELGMRYADGTPRPVLTETGRIAKILAAMKGRLPRAHEDAVCILTHSQQQWGTAYMTCCLAKQAGINLRFAWCEDELPDSKLYIVPSITGNWVMPRRRYLELRRRVEEGATLYISNDNGILSEFESLTGLSVEDSCLVRESGTLSYNGSTFKYERSRRYEMIPTTAEVLAYDDKGFPIISQNMKGEGRVIYVNFPLETMLIEQSHAFDDDQYLIYRGLFSDTVASHEAVTESPFVALTFHYEEDGGVICAAVNYSYSDQKTELKIAEGYVIDEILYGTPDEIPAFDAAIFRLKAQS